MAVAYPKSTTEVSQIAKVCNTYKVPIIPFSGGSSLEGNFSAPYGGVSVDFAFMDQAIGSMVEPIRWLVDSDFRPVWKPGMKP